MLLLLMFAFGFQKCFSKGQFAKSRRFWHLTDFDELFWNGNNVLWYSILHESWSVKTWRLQFKVWYLV